MSNELIERLDLWIAEYDNPIFSQIILLLKDCKAEIQRLSAVGEPVACFRDRLTHAEKRYNEELQDGDEVSIASTRADYLAWKEVVEVYTAPPSVDALIAEIDELCFDEASGGYFWTESIHPSVIKEILDKYRSAK